MLMSGVFLNTTLYQCDFSTLSKCCLKGSFLANVHDMDFNGYVILTLKKWNRMDWTGLDWTGLDWTGLDWTGLDWTGLDWTRLDCTEVDCIALHCTALEYNQIKLNWIKSNEPNFNQIQYNQIKLSSWYHNTSYVTVESMVAPAIHTPMIYQ